MFAILCFFIFLLCILVFTFSINTKTRIVASIIALATFIPFITVSIFWLSIFIPTPNSQKSILAESISPNQKYLVRVYSHTSWLEPDFEVYYQELPKTIFSMERKIGTFIYDLEGFPTEITTFWNEDSSKFYMYSGYLCGFAYNIKYKFQLERTEIPPFLDIGGNQEFLSLLIKEGANIEVMIRQAESSGDKEKVEYLSIINDNTNDL